MPGPPRCLLDTDVLVLHFRKSLAPRGELIADADLLIAATAQTHGLTLVTHNTQHFSRVTSLKVEDWTR